MRTLFITGESGTIPMQIQKFAESYDFRVVNTQLETNFLTCQKTHQSFKVRPPELDFLLPTLKEFDFWPEIDLIIHSGAFVGTDYCNADPNLAIKTNVEGTQNIVDICNKYNIPLIYLSTTAILDPKYYDVNNPMSEFTPIDPQTLYGISKYAGELIVKNICNTNRLILRPVFGFGNYPDDLHSALTKVIYVLYRNIKENKNTQLTVLLDKLIAKSYTRVENIANCILSFAKILGKGTDCTIYNIGENSTRSKDWFQLINIIAFMFKLKGICTVDKVIDTFNNKIEFKPDKDYLHFHNMDDQNLKIIGLDFYGQENYISTETGISLTLDSVIKNIDKEPYWL